MRVLTLLGVFVALAVGCTGEPPPPPKAEETRPTLLAALNGTWVMVGDVLGEPVKYNLIASPVLAGTFTELHMTDVQTPPQYEARIFIAHDRESGQIIVHWLDVFGGKGSVPHGTGQITDNMIEFIIPYADGPFRDRLTHDSRNGTWRFTIESSDVPGQWKHFAAYEIERIK
ncbi:MAG TPA: hypothetical protein VJB15_07365 [Rhodothermia bacterium]|nr:hypothetical protein [Rhodothermia bacterium]